MAPVIAGPSVAFLRTALLNPVSGRGWRAKCSRHKVMLIASPEAKLSLMLRACTFAAFTAFFVGILPRNQSFGCI